MIVVRRNFLDQELIKKIQFVLDIAITDSTPNWYTSMSWPKDVRMDSGVVCIRPTPQFIEPISEHLARLDPELGKLEIMVQLYVWLPGSHIPWHNDAGKSFGATIYLNESWDRNCGGAFLYEENGEIRAELPEYNKLVLNRGGTLHRVSAIPNSCSDKRKTIQIWGL